MANNKKSLITGITGQDGSYLAEFLLDKGYEVYGLKSHGYGDDLRNILPIRNKIKFISADLGDQSSLIKAVRAVGPDEIYNLAAQSFVKKSWDQPEYTADITGLGALRILEAIRLVNPKIKYYQASSSEMFGNAEVTPQNEKTPFCPRSPYGMAKLYAHWATVNYRETYGIFACSGILYNHESPRRSPEYVTKKIVAAVARIKSGLKKDKLRLGNLEAKRDWGYAPEYIKAMWLMMQRKKSDTFVIATGQTHSVKEFMETAFELAGLDWRRHVIADRKYLRPVEPGFLVGDASKAEKILGWKPKIKFKQLVKIMLEADLKLISEQAK
ncbi:MAG: GDP-mannose 4,6-dehydratase [bacterium]|nr:GDP-mannose 4,6-dehydratase [bacterium]